MSFIESVWDLLFRAFFSNLVYSFNIALELKKMIKGKCIYIKTYKTLASPNTYLSS